jgi:hypothetical protein
VLVDLTDAIAEQVQLPLDRLSLEMVFRGLYFYCGAAARGEADDPVAYLAAQTDLGIVKRRRKYRERAAEARAEHLRALLDTHAPAVNLRPLASRPRSQEDHSYPSRPDSLACFSSV